MPAARGRDEEELEALRKAVDVFQTDEGRKLVQSPEVQRIIRVVESFIRKKRLICYGGTAINNVLPPDAQFYAKESELPDYDFFSMRAYEDARELADIYAKEGYTQVEAKSGVHFGTYKVFVNYIPVADVTQLAPPLFKALTRDTELKTVDGIRYAPPNYLRMSMYLELSRPRGDVSRWEKVLKRLALLNKYHPLKAGSCKASDFLREFESGEKEGAKVFRIVRDSVAEQGLVFFGGYAAALYSKHMSKAQQKLLKNVPDFDVLSEDPKGSADVVANKLRAAGEKQVAVGKRAGIGEIIAPHYEVRVGKEIVLFVYEPLACHSYNLIKVGGRSIKVATIDTMLSFYLAFLYANRPYYDHTRLLCMAEYLFTVQAKNRYAQKGLLRRWTPSCYGSQATLSDMRQEKSKAFDRLKDKRGSLEWNKWFLNYAPGGGGDAEAQRPDQSPTPRSTPGTRTVAVTEPGYTSVLGPTSAPTRSSKRRSKRKSRSTRRK